MMSFMKTPSPPPPPSYYSTMDQRKRHNTSCLPSSSYDSHHNSNNSRHNNNNNKKKATLSQYFFWMRDECDNKHPTSKRQNKTKNNNTQERVTHGYHIWDHPVELGEHSKQQQQQHTHGRRTCLDRIIFYHHLYHSDDSANNITEYTSESNPVNDWGCDDKTLNGHKLQQSPDQSIQAPEISIWSRNVMLQNTLSMLGRFSIQHYKRNIQRDPNFDLRQQYRQDLGLQWNILHAKLSSGVYDAFLDVDKDKPFQSPFLNITIANHFTLSGNGADWTLSYCDAKQFISPTHYTYYSQFCVSEKHCAMCWILEYTNTLLQKEYKRNVWQYNTVDSDSSEMGHHSPRPKWTVYRNDDNNEWEDIEKFIFPFENDTSVYYLSPQQLRLERKKYWTQLKSEILLYMVQCFRVYMYSPELYSNHTEEQWDNIATQWKQQQRRESINASFCLERYNHNVLTEYHNKFLNTKRSSGSGHTTTINTLLGDCSTNVDIPKSIPRTKRRKQQQQQQRKQKHTRVIEQYHSALLYAITTHDSVMFRYFLTCVTAQTMTSNTCASVENDDIHTQKSMDWQGSDVWLWSFWEIIVFFTLYHMYFEGLGLVLDTSVGVMVFDFIENNDHFGMMLIFLSRIRAHQYTRMYTDEREDHATTCQCSTTLSETIHLYEQFKFWLQDRIVSGVSQQQQRHRHQQYDNNHYHTDAFMAYYIYHISCLLEDQCISKKIHTTHNDVDDVGGMVKNATLSYTDLESMRWIREKTNFMMQRKDSTHCNYYETPSKSLESLSLVSMRNIFSDNIGVGGNHANRNHCNDGGAWENLKDSNTFASELQNILDDPNTLPLYTCDTRNLYTTINTLLDDRGELIATSKHDTQGCTPHRRRRHKAQNQMNDTMEKYILEKSQPRQQRHDPFKITMLMSRWIRDYCIVTHSDFDDYLSKYIYITLMIRDRDEINTRTKIENNVDVTFLKWILEIFITSNKKQQYNVSPRNDKHNNNTTTSRMDYISPLFERLKQLHTPPPQQCAQQYTMYYVDSRDVPTDSIAQRYLQYSIWSDIANPLHYCC